MADYTLLSAAVLTTDRATAAQYNNLRSDAVAGHNHSGGTTPVVAMLNNKFLTGETAAGVAKSLLGVDASNVLQLGASGLTVNVPVAATFAAGATLSAGNLAFGTTGQKVTGDLSNATHANRVLFQSSTTNGATALGVLPNGSGTIGQIFFYGGSDPDNAGHLTLRSTGVIDTNKVGGGTSPTLTLRAGGNTGLSIDPTAGAVTVAGSIGFYGATPGAKPTITGSRGANAALASLLTALATLGLLTDSSS